MKRIVTIEAVSGRYAKNGKHVFHAMPYFDSVNNNYITGQERNSDRPHGLTKSQIEMKEPLTDAQIKAFPFPILIDPEKRGVMPIYKKRTLDLSTDDKGNYIRKDHLAYYEFIIEGLGQIIAKNKDAVDSTKHLFYLNDPQREASKRVKTKREIFKMTDMVMKNLDATSYYELILTLNFNTNDNYDFNNVSSDIIEDFVFDACEKHSDLVKSHFTEKGQRELFILKLVHHGIIFYRNAAFHDKNDKFLGNSITEVLSYIEKKENQLAANSWAESLKNKDDRFAQALEDKKAKNKEVK
ncbi:MAG: hypothetical protein JXR64_02980 [Spirochaetales bacterium]|nr:hypothetical protein [Spirochaetales bacterium]